MSRLSSGRSAVMSAVSARKRCSSSRGVAGVAVGAACAGFGLGVCPDDVPADEADDDDDDVEVGAGAGLAAAARALRSAAPTMRASVSSYNSAVTGPDDAVSGAPAVGV